MNDQEVGADLSGWRLEWDKARPLPHARTLKRIQQEMVEHRVIRRSFIFDVLAKDSIDLIIGSMIWGWGDDRPHGTGRMGVRKALDNDGHAEASIAATRLALEQGGIEAGYRTMFKSGVKLPGVGAATATRSFTSWATR
jgi:hypothetical protein